MSGKFAGLKTVGANVAPAVAQPTEATVRASDRPSRHGKKVVSGHFSPELSRSLNMLAVEQDKTVQGLLGEALDLLLRHYDKHPYGER